MMKKFTLLTFLFVQSLVFAQKQYYDFAWQDKFGIADSTGAEIVSPIYDWCMYTLDDQSDFIALNSKENGALVINTQNGFQEKFDHLAGAMTIDLEHPEGKGWIHGNKNKHSYLINNKNLNVQIPLPKYYQEVWQRGPYLIAFTKYEKFQKPAVADILDKESFNPIKENLPLINIHNFVLKNKENLFVVQQEKGMLVFDKDFKLIEKINKVMDYEELEKYLPKNYKISTEENGNQGAVAMAVPREYPYYDGNLIDGDFIVTITEKDKTKRPVFKFKFKDYRLTSGEIKRPYEIMEYEKGSQSSLRYAAKFYLHPKTYVPLIPKKYWADLGLELIDYPLVTQKPERPNFIFKEMLPEIGTKFFKNEQWEENSSSKDDWHNKNMKIYEKNISNPKVPNLQSIKLMVFTENDIIGFYGVGLQMSEKTKDLEKIQETFTPYFPALKDDLFFAQLMYNGKWMEKKNGYLEDYFIAKKDDRLVMYYITGNL